MKSTVVYESRYGNTERIAGAIANSLEAFGPVRLVEAADETAFDVDDVDLIVVGGPTEGHGASVSLRARLLQVPPGALWGVDAATFDTRLTWPAFLAGSAAKGLAQILRQQGARMVAEPESFLVKGTREPHLVDGECERAGTWAAKLATDVRAASPIGS